MKIKVFGEEIECGAVIKRTDKIIVLDENGSVIREDSGITNFDGYAMVEGEWTVEDEVPTTEERVTDLEDTTAALEDAICEMDEANDERMAAIEDALCEMDMG